MDKGSLPRHQPKQRAVAKTIRASRRKPTLHSARHRFATKKKSPQPADLPTELESTLYAKIYDNKPLPKTKLTKLTHPALLYRVAYLQSVLHSASQAYYLNKPGAKLTDAQFDKLFVELSLHETAFPHHLTFLRSDPTTLLDTLTATRIEDFRVSVVKPKSKDAKINEILELLSSTPFVSLHKVLPSSVTSSVGAPIAQQDQEGRAGVELVQTPTTKTKSTRTKAKSSPTTSSTSSMTATPSSASKSSTTIKSNRKPSSVSFSEGKRLLKHNFPMRSIQSVFDLKTIELFSKSSIKNHQITVSKTQQALIKALSAIRLPLSLTQSQQNAFTTLKAQITQSPFFHTAQPESIALFSSMLQSFFTLSQEPNQSTLAPLLDIIATLQSHPITQSNNFTEIPPLPPLLQTSEQKYDGIAISVDFEEGQRLRAVTRGDGEQGYDVTETLSSYAKSPKQLNIQQLNNDIVMLLTQQFIYMIFQFTGRTTHLSQQDYQQSSQLWDEHVVRPLNKYFLKNRQNRSDMSSSTDILPLNIFSHDFPSVSSPTVPVLDQQSAQIIAEMLPHILSLFTQSLNQFSPDISAGSINIRGECIVPRNQWAPGGHYSSPRHLVSGLFNSLEGSESAILPQLALPESKIVDFLPYSMNFKHDHDGGDVLDLPTSFSHNQRLLLLKNQNFSRHSGVTHFIQANANGSGHITSDSPTPIVPTPTTSSNPLVQFRSTVSDHIGLLEGAQADFPYDCDGLVVKTNSILTQAEAGSTSHHPRWAIAPKFQGDYATTILQDISLQVGKSGKVVPVAHLKPVFVSGSTIQKVVLHNHNQLSNELFSTIKVGDEVTVEKRGGAIPMISGKGQRGYKDLKLDSVGRHEDWVQNVGKSLIDIVPCQVDMTTPSKTAFLCPCPTRSVLEHVENSTGSTSASLFCVSPMCKSKVLATLSFYTGKNGLDIPSLSTMTLESLFDLKLINNNPSSLLRLVYDARYRSSLYKLGGFSTPDSHHLGEQSSLLKDLTTPWDGTHIVTPGSLPPPSIAVGQIQGFQKKKIEKLLSAIEQQHMSTSPEEHDQVLETILLGYGLTQTHVSALRELIAVNDFDSLSEALPWITRSLSVDQIVSQTEIRAATARDMYAKFTSIQPELQILRQYKVPCLQSLSQL